MTGDFVEFSTCNKHKHKNFTVFICEICGYIWRSDEDEEVCPDCYADSKYIRRYTGDWNLTLEGIEKICKEFGGRKENRDDLRFSVTKWVWKKTENPETSLDDCSVSVLVEHNENEVINCRIVICSCGDFFYYSIATLEGLRYRLEQELRWLKGNFLK